MGLLSIIGGLVKPVFGMIDDFHLSGEEKGQMKIALETLHQSVITEGLKHDAEIASFKASVIIAETKSESWITRSWRPIIMLMFGTLIMLIATGLMDTEALAAVPDKLWNLISIGLGGYIVSRGAEKTIPKIVGALKKREEL